MNSYFAGLFKALNEALADTFKNGPDYNGYEHNSLTRKIRDLLLSFDTENFDRCQ